MKQTLFVLTICIVLAIPLTGCASASTSPTETIVAPTLGPSTEPTNIPYTPEMDLPAYDPAAEPFLPPVSGMWPGAVPAQVIDGDPTFIEHDSPKPAWDASHLEAWGCAMEGEYQIICDEDSPLSEHGCNLVSPADSAHLGYVGFGLDPAYPVLATCLTFADPAADSVFVYQQGCMATYHYTYYIEVDGEALWITEPHMLRDLFAPIETPEEAQSYAELLTGLTALYGFESEFNDTFFYLEEIEDTHVTETEDGYAVHLYHQNPCGCSAFITTQVDVLIAVDGEMTWGAATPAWVGIEPICYD